jgi:hypothetical protein
MDRQPMDPAALAEAKEHCRTCPACARFVRGQLAAKQAPLPQPPGDLVDRVMTVVRAEAAQDAERAAAETQAGAAAPEIAPQAVEAPAPAAPIATLAPPAPRKRPALPRTTVVGLAAAAAVIAMLGVGGVVIFGTKQMAPRTASRTYTIAPNAAESQPQPTSPAASSAPGAALDTSGSGYADSTGAASSGRALAKAGAGPQDITVNGVVYSSVGMVTVNLGTIPVIGGTTSSLGGNSGSTRHDVHSGSTADTVYVADNSGTVFAFKRVTRTYLGQTYVLTARELTDFGQWPGLPAQIQTPTGAEGAPTFSYDGNAGGVKVYRLNTSPATYGIAIAPNSDTGGPAAGNPNWTWWLAGH